MSVIEMNNFKQFLIEIIDIGHNVTDDALNELDKLTDTFIKNVDIYINIIAPIQYIII